MDDEHVRRAYCLVTRPENAPTQIDVFAAVTIRKGRVGNPASRVDGHARQSQAARAQRRWKGDRRLARKIVGALDVATKLVERPTTGECLDDLRNRIKPILEGVEKRLG